MESTFVVVGGGIAAVSCVEQLVQECPSESVTILTASNVVKATSNLTRRGKALETFDVQETDARTIFADCQNVRLVPALVTGLNSSKKELYTSDGRTVKYRKLCIATGGKPKVISSDKSEFVVGIRDTETVKQFQKKLKGARRIVVVGNGGIATELVYEVENVEVIWAIKHKSISATFVDAGAAEFFLPHLSADKKEPDTISKRRKYTEAPAGTSHTVTDTKTVSAEVRGSALGPDWAEETELKGAGGRGDRNVHLEYECEIRRILTGEERTKLGITEHLLPSVFDSAKREWPVYVELSNGLAYGCDLIVSATGVEPNTEIWTEGNTFEIGEDGGLRVNEHFETSIADVYAVGDVCSAGWECAPHWIQMRLWTQARQMGAFGGLCMAYALRGDHPSLGICFEIFTHVTTFFGYKVILLGRFNGQGLTSEHEALVRVTKENLILNQTDVTEIKDGLLDPGVDIEDYFD